MSFGESVKYDFSNEKEGHRVIGLINADITGFEAVPNMALARHDAEKILCEEFNLFEIAAENEKLTAPGWDIPDDAYINEQGYIQWFTEIPTGLFIFKQASPATKGTRKAASGLIGSESHPF